MTDQDKFSELISAFLDGEVSPEEQARVEERLVESAEDRRLFEDMRAIRADLQSLPRRELGKDLSERILRRAERAMLADGTAPDGTSTDETVADADPQRDGVPGAASPPTPPDPGAWRSLIWAGAAIAAAILVMVLVGPQFDEPDAVVRNDAAPAGSSVAADADSADRARSAHEVVLPGEEDMELDTAAGRSYGGDAKAGQGMTRGGEPEKTEEFSFQAKRSTAARGAGPAPPASVESQLADSSAPDFGGGGAGVGPHKGAINGAKMRPSPAQEEQKLAESLDVESRSSVRLARKQDVKGLKNLEIPSNGWMVVELDLAPAAIRQDRFYDSLALNEIDFDARTELFRTLKDSIEASNKDLGEMDEDADRSEGVLDGTATAGVMADGADEGRVAKREAAQIQLAAAGPPEFEVVYVEAPAEQVAGLLDALAEHPNTIALAKSGTGPAAQHWRTLARFSQRGRAPATNLPSSLRKALSAADAEINAVAGEGEPAARPTDAKKPSPRPALVDAPAPAEPPRDGLPTPPATPDLVAKLQQEDAPAPATAEQAVDAKETADAAPGTPALARPDPRPAGPARPEALPEEPNLSVVPGAGVREMREGKAPTVEAPTADAPAAEPPAAEPPAVEAPAAEAPAAEAPADPFGSVVLPKSDARSRRTREPLERTDKPGEAKSDTNLTEAVPSRAKARGEDDSGRKVVDKKKAVATVESMPADSPVLPPLRPSNGRTGDTGRFRDSATPSERAGERAAGEGAGQMNDDAFGEEEGEEEQVDQYRRQVDPQPGGPTEVQRGFAQRLYVAPRRNETAAATRSPKIRFTEPTPQPTEFGGLGGGADGGFGPGGGQSEKEPTPTPPPVPADEPAGEDSAETNDGRAVVEKAPTSPPPTSGRLVRVLFVLRAVKPTADLAGNVASDAAAAKAALVPEVDAAAEAEASEAVMDAAAPTVP